MTDRFWEVLFGTDRDVSGLTSQKAREIQNGSQYVLLTVTMQEKLDEKVLSEFLLTRDLDVQTVLFTRDHTENMCFLLLAFPKEKSVLQREVMDIKNMLDDFFKSISGHLSMESAVSTSLLGSFTKPFWKLQRLWTRWPWNRKSIMYFMRKIRKWLRIRVAQAGTVSFPGWVGKKRWNGNGISGIVSLFCQEWKMPLKGCQGLLSGNYRDIEKIPSKRYADTQKHSHQSESDHWIWILYSAFQSWRNIFSAFSEICPWLLKVSVSTQKKTFWRT